MEMNKRQNFVILNHKESAGKNVRYENRYSNCCTQCLNLVHVIDVLSILQGVRIKGIIVCFVEILIRDFE